MRSRLRFSRKVRVLFTALALGSLLGGSSPVSAEDEFCPWERTALTPTQLREVLEDHKRWLADPNDGQPANLCNANLRLADIQGANLARANLQGANLEAVEITGINLSGANLQGSNMQDAHFKSANFKRADLSNASLRRFTVQESDLRRVNFSGSDLTHCTLAGNRLDSAQFQHAVLTQCNLMGANLSKALLQGTDLSQARLNDAILKQADLRSANLEQANLTNADLTESDAHGANFTLAEMRGTRLDGVVLGEANLEKALYLARGQPDSNSISGLHGLSTLRLVPSHTGDGFTREDLLNSITKPDAGVQLLRQALQSGGETEAVKELSYLISKRSASLRNLPMRFLSAIFLEWPSDYGMDPQRPLRRLLELTLGCALLYLLPLTGLGPAGINRLWKGAGPLDRMERPTHRWRKQRIHNRGLGLPLYALTFSLASMVGIRGKGLPLYTLTGVLSERPYTLRSTGWVSIVTVVQCGLSLILIGTWGWLNLG